ncbi:hypothetical protein KGM48_01285 [Patescibacteria group bacterium]|nr:hypothetical protein [Patescibacteria group bacterium]
MILWYDDHRYLPRGRSPGRPTNRIILIENTLRFVDNASQAPPNSGWVANALKGLYAIRYSRVLSHVATPAPGCLWVQITSPTAIVDERGFPVADEDGKLAVKLLWAGHHCRESEHDFPKQRLGGDDTPGFWKKHFERSLEERRDRDIRQAERAETVFRSEQAFADLFLKLVPR